MHYLIKYLDKLFQLKKEKGWKYLYFMIDIHNTVIKPTYDKSLEFEFFPYASECLQMLCKKDDVKLIMWTSSYHDVCEKYREEFRKYDVIFDYVNENPEMKNDDIRCLDSKFYYDLGIDDKFGFDAETDWKPLYDYIIHNMSVL